MHYHKSAQTYTVLQIAVQLVNLVLDLQDHVELFYVYFLGPDRKLKLKDEFLLVMMNLRLGLLEQDLADRFGVSQTTVSRIINQWLPLLAFKMKKLIRMPKADKVIIPLPTLVVTLSICL